MVKIDIFSGFLGAGKTTLIKKLIAEAFKNEKIVLIENEFGEIAIDGGFLQEAGVEITEMSQGCICCSLVGDFEKALKKVIEDYHPERIVIEPSGVGKLSDVIIAVQSVDSDEIVLNSFTTVADAKKVKMYMKNFGEFYNDQIEHANSIVLSRTKDMTEEKLDAAVAMLKEKNSVATIITTDWDAITGLQILETMEHKNTLQQELEQLKEEAEHHHHHHDDDEEECECGHHHHHHDDDEEECECGHHHHHHDDDEEECECGHHHHHDDDEEECECGHHHHHDDDEEECECGHHHHHHDDDEHECDDPNCSCHHDHHHHHHGHHHADEVFTSWGKETSHKYSVEEIDTILTKLDLSKYGIVLRAKGIVEGKDGNWIHFDYVPEEKSVRVGPAIAMGRFCVIGSKLDEEELEELFSL